MIVLTEYLNLFMLFCFIQYFQLDFKLQILIDILIKNGKNLRREKII